MNIRKLTLPLVVVIAVMLIGAPGLFAQAKKMTMEEYSAQLVEWQKREAEAKAVIATVQTDIERLKKEIASAEEENTKTWQEIYAALETDEAGVKNYMVSLENLENEVDGLSNLSADDLYGHKKELEALEAKLTELKQSKIGALTESQDKIAVIVGKLTQLKRRMDAAKRSGTYEVLKGDYLWKIAKKDEIDGIKYGDPYLWIAIYTRNKLQITDPDLIYPAQKFSIPDINRLESGEYLVVKGDYLKLIAGKSEVLGDPTRWTEIYEENKPVIEKSNKTPGSKMLYPYQILRIPVK
jgi:nucleoid-associated protein YgaU